MPATGMPCGSEHRAGPGAEADGTGLWVAWRDEPTRWWTGPANATEPTGPNKVPGKGLSFHRNVVFLLSNIKTCC